MTNLSKKLEALQKENRNSSICIKNTIKENKYPLEIYEKRGYNLLDIRDSNKVLKLYSYN
jgi:hypothetical protein